MPSRTDRVRVAWAPPVRLLLSVLAVFVLVLPFVMLGVTRVLDNALILQTEHALLVEAAAVGEVYRRSRFPSDLGRLGDPTAPDRRFYPLSPKLDLADSPLLPPTTREGQAEWAPADDHLSVLLERTRVRTLSGLRVLDENGQVVASSSYRVGYSLAHLPEVRAALGGDYRPVFRQRFSDSEAPGLTSISRAASLRVSLALPVFRDPRTALGEGGAVIGAVYAARTPLGRNKALWAWREKLMLPGLVSLAITLVVAVFLGFTLSRPLGKLRRHAERVAEGSLAVDGAPPSELDGGLGPVAPEEVVALGTAVRRMQEKLEARAQYIRTFAANAAHELKTPLTSLRGAADLLLEAGAEMDDARRARFARNIRDDAVRMNALVQRLLDLARIEVTPPVRRPVDLADFLEGVRERYGRLGVEVVVSYEAASRAVLYDPDLLESLLTNLLDNAARHGPGEPIRVTVEDSDEGRVLSVRNHGPTLAPGALDRAFERFYSTERSGGGTGLGLSIVRAIAEAHGGRAGARVEERGATFVVTLPNPMCAVSDRRADETPRS